MVLANVTPIVNGVYSGGEPDTEVFSKLHNLKIKTIISVDGKIPDLKGAQEIGARYIHLPIGYDGISSERAEQFAYAFQTAPRPLYIHCHHGLHRGPTALALGLVATGEIDTEKALKLLNTIGTSKDYQGLWKTVREATPMVEIKPQPLPEVTEVSDFITQMSLIDEYFDTLKSLSKNEWKPLATHPDETSAQSALLLYEAYRELNRAKLPEVTAHEAFPSSFLTSEQLAKTLYDSLKKNAPLAERNQNFITLKQDCRSCHQKYRD